MRDLMRKDRKLGFKQLMVLEMIRKSKTITFDEVKKLYGLGPNALNSLKSLEILGYIRQTGIGKWKIKE